MKRILVTGAAGFIGFHTSLALKKRGDFVVGLDNFNSYYSPALKRARAKQLAEAGIEVVEADLCNRTVLEALFEKHSFTHLLNLAAQAGVRYSFKDPEAYLKCNIDGFLTVLETLKGKNGTKLVYASSSSVYGLNEKVPFSVADTTDKPANLYAATKKANELMAYCYNQLFGICSTGLRYFTVYGPWGRPDMAYFSFTKAILEGKPISLFKNGEMSRDFTYIEDIVSGTIGALDFEGECELFNLGNSNPVSVKTLIQLLEKLLGKKAEILFEEKGTGEVPTTYADIEKSSKLLKYAPKTGLEEGLAHFLEWYDQYHACLK